MTHTILRGIRMTCLVAMQVSIVTLSLFILGTIGQSESSQPARWPELAAMMVVGLAGQRLMSRVPARLRAVTWLLVAIVPLVLLLKSWMGGGIHPGQGWEYLLESRRRNLQEFLFGIAGLLLVLRRAITLPNLGAFELASLFRTQVIVLTIVLLGSVYFFRSALGVPEVQSTLSTYVFIFMTTSLLGIVFGQLPKHETAAKQGQIVSSSVLPVVAILLVGMAVAAAFSSAARVIVLVLIDGLVYLLLLPIVLLGLIAGGISNVLLPDRLEQTPIRQGAPPMKFNPDALKYTEQSVADDRLIFWTSFVSYALTLGVLVGLGFLVLRWLRPIQESSDELIERSSVWSWQDVRQSLRDLAARLRPQARPDKPAAPAANDPIYRIRQAYRGLLRLAAEHEHARLIHQTPREFSVAAQPVAPAANPELAQLTALYEQARYGPSPSPQQAQAAEAALLAIGAATSRAEQEIAQPTVTLD